MVVVMVAMMTCVCVVCKGRLKNKKLRYALLNGRVFAYWTSVESSASHMQVSVDRQTYRQTDDQTHTGVGIDV